MRPAVTELYETRRSGAGRAGTVAGAGGGSSTDWNCVIGCAAPSSRMVKSARVRPGTGSPFLSSTTTSTVTRSTPDLNRAGGCCAARST